METKLERLPKSKVKINISLNRDELKPHFEKAYEKIALTLKVDGFRPGKAPKKLVEELSGQTRIIQETVDFALEQSYPQALAKEKLYPVNQPKIVIDSTPSLNEGDLEYTVEFDCLPEAKLGDYSKQKVKKPEIQKITDKDLDKVLEYLKKQKATFKEVTRGAKNGDRLEINFEGSVKGVAKEGMSSKNHPLILGEKVMLPDFEKALEGMKKGEKKKFKVKFPKDYHSKDVAGETADFEVEVIDLKETVLPEINDEFAKSFGHDSTEVMKKAITDSLIAEAELKAKQELESAIVDEAVKKITVDIPDSLIEQETDRMVDVFRQQIESQGMGFDRYLISIKKTLEDIRKDMSKQAEKNVRIGFLLGEVIKQEKFDPKDKQSGRKAIDHLIMVMTK